MFSFDNFGSAFCRLRASASAPNLRKGAAILAASGLWACAGSAFAGNAELSVSVYSIPNPAPSATVPTGPVPNDISIGHVLKDGSLVETYVAYAVSITNTSTNVINGVRFTGTPNVTPTSAVTPAVFERALSSSPGVSCSTGNPDSVYCDIGKLNGDGSAGNAVAFVLLFKAPSIGSGVTFTPDSSTLDLGWQVLYSNGSLTSGGTPTSLVCNGSTTNSCLGKWTDNLVAGATTVKKFGTYIPPLDLRPAGIVFATGNGSAILPLGTTDPTSTAATRVTIPQGLATPLTYAAIDQNVTAGGSAVTTTTKVTSTITVPTSGNEVFDTPVTIELRRDASTITKGAKFGDVDPLSYITYSHDGVNTYLIKECPFPFTTTALSNVVPPVCLDKSASQEFTKRTAPTSDDVGDWSFIFRALENGAFRY